MKQLTYADRELLLQTFDSLKREWRGSDEELLGEACDWAKALSPKFGFEHALTRDIATLSRYLTERKDDQDIAEIARGGLLFVLHANTNSRATFGDFGLLDDAFISSYAVHEVRIRLGDTARYNPPRLTHAEQERAENLFLEFVEKSFMDDVQLVSKARQIGESLGNLAASGLFRRLSRNIDFLILALADVRRSEEHRSLARAALAYFVCEDDAIDDRLGLVGYFDDNFIAQMAIDMIEPGREPWLELLDATIGAWPFLNAIFVDDGGGVRSISEYMVINSALTCREVRTGSDLNSTILIVPLVGPTPLLMGFVATLGLIQGAAQRDLTCESFRDGQKVIVDHCAVAEFAGFASCNGREMFKLRQYRTEQSQRLESVHYWPISDLRRLVPADGSRATRGSLTHDLSRSDAILPALEYVFNASKTAQLSAVQKRVLIVTPIALAHSVAKSIQMHGQPLKDVIPMGHVSPTQGVVPWSTRFGQQEPLLLIASDLDHACAYAEEKSEQIQIVIVDAAGRNCNKNASLRRLQHFGISTLVIAAERSADQVDLEAEKSGVWEWQDEDLAALLWPSTSFGARPGSLATFESRMQTRSSTPPITHSIVYEPAERAFEAVRHVRFLARHRGEEQLAELDDIVSLSYNLMTRLLRSATVLSESVPSHLDITSGLAQLLATAAGSRYLTGDERLAIANAESTLRQLFLGLQRENPKAQLVGKLLKAAPTLSLICPDARLQKDIETAFPRARTFVACNEDGGHLDGAVIPGWFRKDRMAMLLVPPVTQPIHLVLYGIEQRWHAAFWREREKMRKARSGLKGGRKSLFPNVEGWRKQTPSPTEPEELNRDLLELEAIQQDVHSGYRQRIYRSAQSDGSEDEAPARLIILDGGAHAFLTDSYRANVVTHLLEDVGDDSDGRADVKQKGVSEIVPGDALLFNRGSDRDVIRTAADTILAPGVRETSSLWRRALFLYSVRLGLTPESLHAELQKSGCPLTRQTIEMWLDNEDIIAPQAYKRDVKIIAQVTGDATLARRMDEVIAAIYEVRSAHLRGSHLLAKRVLAEAVHILRSEGEPTSLNEAGANVVVARVVEVASKPTLVRASLLNRLLEGESWHE